jgi:hypothetical protein
MRATTYPSPTWEQDANEVVCVPILPYTGKIAAPKLWRVKGQMRDAQ